MGVFLNGLIPVALQSVLRRTGSLAFVTGFILTVMPVTLLHAQQSDAEVDEVEEKIESQREVQRTGDDALDLDGFGDGQTVTYQQVLADPDNIDLNFRFALTQIRQGNVRGAGATLERILLIQPELAEVRVLFAIVLFRLDNLDEAERELRAVRELDLTDDLRDQIERYLAQIENRRKKTKFTLAVNFTSQYDWNRNAASSSERRLAFGLPTVNTGASSRQDDLSQNGLAQFGFEHDIGAQKRHMMVGGLVFYQGEQVQQDDLDLQAISANFGFELDFAPDTITPKLIYENILLSREKYYQARGASVDWKHDMSNTWALFSSARVKYQSYQNISGNTTATERSGRNLQLKVGTSQVLDPTQRIRVSLERTRNSSSRRFHSYNRHELAGSHTLLFGSGAFLLSSLTFTLDGYDGNDPSVNGQKRRDVAGRARLTYGVPLEALADETPDLLKGFTLTVSGEAYRQVSNITNFTYNNYRVSIGVNRRWEF